MTALPHHANVTYLINARRARITVGNSPFPPLAKDPERQREVAEAEREAPMIVDAKPEDFPPPVADRRPAIADRRLPGAAALVAISVGVVLGVAAAALIIIAFEWLVKVML